MKETGESSYGKGNESETNPWTMMEFTDESQIISPASPDSYPPVDEGEPEPAKKSHWLQEFGSNGQMVEFTDEAESFPPASPDAYPPVEEPTMEESKHHVDGFGTDSRAVDVSDGPSHKLKTFGGNEEEITIYDAPEGMTPTPTPEPPKWNPEQ
ncbi:hypothetical protein IKX12_02270 [Candidatus Saccharibacteria bacterium]|nr:hypothetical protein [Candidatus Saccharibacteria bacterium]